MKSFTITGISCQLRLTVNESTLFSRETRLAIVLQLPTLRVKKRKRIPNAGLQGRQREKRGGHERGKGGGPDSGSELRPNGKYTIRMETVCCITVL
jgi:hypothetical protein